MCLFDAAAAAAAIGSVVAALESQRCLEDWVN